MTNTRIFTFMPYNDYYTWWQHHKHTYIYIYTIQRLLYPMEAWQTHAYLHLYHTMTTIPDGSMTIIGIFIFIPYNDYYTRWQHDKHTYIYIYTIQRLLYPMESWQTHVYLHLYHTTTIIPDGSMTNTRIFTFIPYNDYYTRWKQDKHTYIYIYTIQRLQYPMEAGQTHVYLHLYHTTTAIPDGSMTNTRIFTFIPYNDYYTRWKHDKHTYIYMYTIQRLLYPMESWQTHVYLHLYHTTTKIPDGSMTNTRIFTFIPYNDCNTRWKHDKHTYIYIYTIQRLLYPMEAWETHVYLHLYHTTTTIPDGSMTNTRIFTFIPYNDYNTRWKHDKHTYIYIYTIQRLHYTRWQHHKHTYIYIYTIQRLLYPMEAWQKHVYLHLYHTTTTIPDGSMTNTRIFTFIPYNDYNTRCKHDNHTYIFIYTIQRLLYPMAASQTHVYLHLYHTTTIIPDGGMTNTRIFTFIPYNDYYTRWQYDKTHVYLHLYHTTTIIPDGRHEKHTYIYFYTVQRQLYPMEAWQTHVYLHLYHTTTIIPDGSRTNTHIFTFITIQRLQYPMEAWQSHVYLYLFHTTTIIPDGSITNTRIFTFIPDNDYNTRWKHDKHTHIYIYTIQRIQYPVEAWQSHVYLHLYNTTTIIPRWQQDKHTYIYIYTIQRLHYTRWKHDKHTYIYIYTIQRLQYPMEAWQTYAYLHLYHTTTIIPDGSMTNTRIFRFIPYNDYNTRWKHDKHTYIYIYTIQRLQYPMEAWQYTRIFTFIPYNDYNTRWKQDKHMFIYIYTIQRIQYPMEAWQTHVYLHLYHTTITIPDGSMTITCIFSFIPYNDYYNRWKHDKHTYIYIYAIQRIQYLMAASQTHVYFTFIPYNDYYTRWKHDKHTHIYIYTIQRLQYPMEAWQSQVYLYLYHTTTIIPDGSMTNTRIFTFIPYNDCIIPDGSHVKHTYIYIYTIQRLQYPMEAWQTHVYLHLYHTTTIIPDGSMTNTRIFTFIPYNDYNTRWKHDNHTHIYISTIQRLL